MLYGIGYTTIPVEKGPLFDVWNTMIEAPSNYKDPLKIKEYIERVREKRKEEAARTHMMCRLGDVAIYNFGYPKGGFVELDRNNSLLRNLAGKLGVRAGCSRTEYAVRDESLFMNLLILDHLGRGLTLDKTDGWVFQSKLGKYLFPIELRNEDPDFDVFDPFVSLTRTTVFQNSPAAVAAEFGFRDDPDDTEVKRMARMAYYLGQVMGRDAE